MGLVMVVVAAAGDYRSRITRIDQRIFDCRVKIQTLESERDKALEELRNGLFCSKCERSKSEIERTGESFEAHLARVHGQAVANSAMMARKAAFYDRQIQELQNQIALLEQMKNQLAEAARQQANSERQQAQAERLRQERERQRADERQRLQQMQAQMEQARRERERIVRKSETIAEGYRQASETVNGVFNRLKDTVQQQMEERRLEREVREAREAQREMDEQLAAMQEKIAAQQQRVEEAEHEEPTPSSGFAPRLDSVELPPAIALREPPAEGGRETPASGPLEGRRDPNLARSLNQLNSPSEDSGGMAGSLEPAIKLSSFLEPTMGGRGQESQPSGTAAASLKSYLSEQAESLRAMGDQNSANTTMLIGQGSRDVTLSQVGAAAVMAKGAGEIASQFADPATRSAYEALEAAGDAVAAARDNNAPSVAVNASKLGEAGVKSFVTTSGQASVWEAENILGLKQFGKVNAALGALNNASQGDTLGAAADFASFAGNDAAKRALTVESGIQKLFEGGKAVFVEGPQIKGDLSRLQSEAVRTRVHLYQEAATLDALRDKVFSVPVSSLQSISPDYYDSILLPAK